MKPLFPKSFALAKVDKHLEIEYSFPLYDADVAQSVEQLIRNEQVTGSIPVVG